jgi:head-tail adaptor
MVSSLLSNVSFFYSTAATRCMRHCTSNTRTPQGRLAEHWISQAHLFAHSRLRPAVTKMATVSAARMHVYIRGRREIQPIYRWKIQDDRINYVRSSSFPASIRGWSELKLFTSIDRCKIMAIPSFILAGDLLTSGGVANVRFRAPSFFSFARAMVIDRHCGRTLAFSSGTSSGCFGWPDEGWPGEEETMTALIAGVVSIAVIWVVVIYGSAYMNKNVQ